MEPIPDSALAEAVRTGEANGWTVQVGPIYTEFRCARENSVEIVGVWCDERGRIIDAEWSPPRGGDDRRQAPPRGKRQWVLDRLEGTPLEP